MKLPDSPKSLPGGLVCRTEVTARVVRLGTRKALCGTSDLRLPRFAADPLVAGEVPARHEAPVGARRGFVRFVNCPASVVGET